MTSPPDVYLNMINRQSILSDLLSVNAQVNHKQFRSGRRNRLTTSLR